METEKKVTSVFETLRAIDVGEHTEKKGDLTYLSWSWAIDEAIQRYPNLTYEIQKFDNNLPYVYDEKTGYMVFTKVTIEGLTKEMWLPVMDGNNNAMLSKPYSYKVKKYEWNQQTRKKEFKGEYEEKRVEAATMFDINKTIMRCLVKNLAVFGLGLYIYAGEDLPEGAEENAEKNKEPKEKKPTEQKKPQPAPATTPASTSAKLTEQQLKLLESLSIEAKQIICEKEKVGSLNELSVFNASKWIEYCQKKGMIANG